MLNSIFLFTLKVFDSTSKLYSFSKGNSADFWFGMWNILVKNTARAGALMVSLTASSFQALLYHLPPILWIGAFCQLLNLLLMRLFLPSCTLLHMPSCPHFSKTFPYLIRSLGITKPTMKSILSCLDLDLFLGQTSWSQQLFSGNTFHCCQGIPNLLI